MSWNSDMIIPLLIWITGCVIMWSMAGDREFWLTWLGMSLIGVGAMWFGRLGG